MMSRLGQGVARRGRGLTLLVCAAVLNTATPAFAQATPDELAHRHFESGVAYLQESDYDNALRAFEKAYELSKRPQILLSIATVHERMGALDKAIDTLNEYLKAAPEGDQAETVRLRIANLQKRIDTEAASNPPESSPSPQPAAAPPQTAPTPSPRVSNPAPAPTGAAQPEPVNHLPAYVLFGVGGVAGAGAVITGLLAKSKYDDAKATCSPTCTDSQLSSSRTLAWTNTALTGVAVVSVGVGAVLFLTADSPAERTPVAGPAPRVRVDVAPGYASAQATWRF